MNSLSDSRNRQMLEEFLQDLIVHSERPGEVDLLVELLEELRQAEREPQRQQTSASLRLGVRSDRYDIFKKYPDRVVRIGFVRGVENARRVLPGLNSRGGTTYFLHGSRLV